LALPEEIASRGLLFMVKIVPWGIVLNIKGFGNNLLSNSLGQDMKICKSTSYFKLVTKYFVIGGM
jgi:hypothetical protein